MKKSILLKLGLPILMVFLITLAIFSNTKVEAEKYMLVPENEIIDSNYIAKGSVIDINGTVNGDAIVMGSNVNVAGDINGNLIVFSSTAVVSGNISGSIIFFGEDLYVKTKNEINSLVSLSETVALESSVKNNVYIISENLRLDGGVIKQDLYTISNIININSKIDRDFVTLTEKITFEEFGKIGRNLKYNTDVNTNLNPKDVAGEIIKYNPDKFNPSTDRYFQNFIKGINIMNLFITFFTLLVLGLLFAKHAKGVSQKVSEKYIKNFGNNSLIGTLVFLLFPLLFIFLFLTVFGINIALFLLLAFILLFVLAYIFTVISIGVYVNKVVFGNNNIFTGVLIGAILFTLLGFVPKIGFFIKLVFIISGLGCIIKYNKEIVNSVKYEEIKKITQKTEVKKITKKPEIKKKETLKKTKTQTNKKPMAKKIRPKKK